MAQRAVSTEPPRNQPLIDSRIVTEDSDWENQRGSMRAFSSPGAWLTLFRAWANAY
jgi:hypothetical protein